MDYRYTLNPHARDRVANYFYQGMPEARLRERDDFGDWTVIAASHTRVVMRHYNGAMLCVAIDRGLAMSYQIIEGDDARRFESEVIREPLPGDGAAVAFAAVLADPTDGSPPPAKGQ